MSAVWMRLRSEMRARWRAWVSLALITGIAAGCAIAAAAGARRTDSAYPRFLRAQDAFHAITGGGAEDDYPEHVKEIKANPLVEDYVDLFIVGGELTLPARRGRPERVFTFPDAILDVEPTATAFYKTNRAKILEGRLPRVEATDEIMIPWNFAERHDIRIGDEVIAGVGFDFETFQPVRRVPFTVVGIEVAPGEFDAVGQTSFPSLHLAPGVYERYRELLEPLADIPDLSMIAAHLRGGASSAYAFKQQVERDQNIDVPLIEPVLTSGIQKTMRLYAVALWLVAALIAIAASAIVGQSLARQINLDAADYPWLRAVGMTRRELFALSFGRATLLAVLSAPLAALVAFALSPLTPIGSARVAEPDPGFAFDGVVIGLGIVATILTIALLALWPSLRGARLFSSIGVTDHETPSRVVASVTRTSTSPAAAAGLRMALERGRGRTAVPVRSTILAVAVGVAAVTATLTVGASLTNLIDSPELAGFTYDAIMPFEADQADPEAPSDADHERAIRAFDFVEETAHGNALNINIGGVDSFLLAFRSTDPFGFAVIRGRAPAPSSGGSIPEIALGPATMRRMGLDLGDETSFAYGSEDEETEEEIQRTLKVRVVGVAAVPPFPWAAIEPGEGAVMPTETLTANDIEGGGCCFVRFKPGTDLDAARMQMAEAGLESFIRTKRADLATLERITALPVLLTGLFGVMAIAALAHVLVTGIRRRRRDLALLKTLGFVTRQVRGAIAWQASVIVVVCAIIGVPAGLVLGRWGWRAIADQFGVVPEPIAPALFIALVLPAMVVLANMIAVLPARSAARTEPAVVLRSE